MLVDIFMTQRFVREHYMILYTKEWQNWWMPCKLF